MGNCYLKSFKEIQITLITRKNYGFIASRIERIHEILWKLSFRVENIAFSRFFFVLLSRWFAADQGPSSTLVVFFLSFSLFFFWITSESLELATSRSSRVTWKLSSEGISVRYNLTKVTYSWKYFLVADRILYRRWT